MSENEAPPILMTYNGTGFDIKPGHWQKLADKHYVIGEQYRMLQENWRSAKSHRHYFATIRDIHQNLPDELLDQHATPEAFRKHALIRTGYCNEITFVAGSEAEARRMVAFWAPLNPEAIILARRNVLIMYTAKSQSVKAMGSKEFQASKDAVLGWMAAQIGATLDQVKANRAANEDAKR